MLSKCNQLDSMYDLVVLDLDMPVCDGFEACKSICKHFENKYVPLRRSSNRHTSGTGRMKDYIPIIVAVSGFIDAATENKIEDSGFNSFFEAPLSVDQIKDEIIPLLEKRKETLQEIDNLDALYKGISYKLLPRVSNNVVHPDNNDDIDDDDDD